MMGIMGLGKGHGVERSRVRIGFREEVVMNKLGGMMNNVGMGMGIRIREWYQAKS